MGGTNSLSYTPSSLKQVQITPYRLPFKVYTFWWNLSTRTPGRTLLVYQNPVNSLFGGPYLKEKRELRIRERILDRRPQ
jgi:hypothetical protein